MHRFFKIKKMHIMVKICEIFLDVFIWHMDAHISMCIYSHVHTWEEKDWPI